MKLKNILIGIGLITSLQGVQSCIDDRGNYSYISNEELLPVTISGFEDNPFNFEYYSRIREYG